MSIPSQTSDAGPLQGAPKRPVDYIEDAEAAVEFASTVLMHCRKDAYEGFAPTTLLRSVTAKLREALEAIESAKAAA